ncbi:diacylglycerol kinase (ATP) [Leucobacter exalbidus]|uniref:Diacylglycerol kinase (ATP) n=1 Tax=Leucobacter exalbidus TaxID=662960 RepID=A0A940PZW0_9MICO|nr:diacylglycerol kinase family protein [Leucobacter exalbidus]MBP1327161.1 diacylglycerol kinase (ATP) [Leucobacter exalbidus]
MTGAPRSPAHLPFALVVNPASALGRGPRVAAKVGRALRAAGVTWVTISASSAAESQRQLAQEIAGGLRGLILVGGDGLISTVLQVPTARKLPIGIVPAGSGNDFARQFDLPRHPATAVTGLLAAEVRPRRVDLGRVTFHGADGSPREHWFAGGLSIGFDAAINRRANALRLPIGPLRYAYGLIAEILALRTRTFRISQQTPRTQTPHTQQTADRSYTGLLATVMNIRTLGGGIPISPLSRTDDGRLELVEVSHARKLRLFSVLGLLARGQHTTLPEVRITSVESVCIDAGDEIAFADGDEVGVGPFHVQSMPGALTVLAA